MKFCRISEIAFSFKNETNIYSSYLEEFVPQVLKQVVNLSCFSWLGFPKVQLLTPACPTAMPMLPEPSGIISIISYRQDIRCAHTMRRDFAHPLLGVQWLWWRSKDIYNYCDSILSVCWSGPKSWSEYTTSDKVGKVN